MKNITQNFKCNKCNEGIVTRLLKETQSGFEITIKKCDNKKCNHQHGIKSINDLVEITEAAIEKANEIFNNR